MSSPAARGPGTAGGVGHAQSCRAETAARRRQRGALPSLRTRRREDGRPGAATDRSARSSPASPGTCSAPRRSSRSCALPAAAARPGGTAGPPPSRASRPAAGQSGGRGRTARAARGGRGTTNFRPAAVTGSAAGAPPRPPRGALRSAALQLPACTAPPPSPAASAVRERSELSRGLGALELRPRGAAFAASLASPALCSQTAIGRCCRRTRLPASPLNLGQGGGRGRAVTDAAAGGPGSGGRSVTPPAAAARGGRARLSGGNDVPAGVWQRDRRQQQPLGLNLGLPGSTTAPAGNGTR